MLLGLAALPVRRPAATRRPAASAAWSRCGPAGSALRRAGAGAGGDAGARRRRRSRSTGSTPAHPVPTHLMYALDADTGQARWVSYESSRSRGRPATSRRRPRKTSVADFPEIGGAELRAGPAQAANLPPAAVSVLSDTTSGGEPHAAAARLVPQRSGATGRPARRRALTRPWNGPAPAASRCRWSRGRAVVVRAGLPRAAGRRLRGRADPAADRHRAGPDPGRGRQRRAGQPAGLPRPTGWCGCDGQPQLGTRAGRQDLYLLIPCTRVGPAAGSPAAGPRAGRVRPRGGGRSRGSGGAGGAAGSCRARR